ncbi:MAG: preprotein translocase subunit SecG [Opitutaceae bacterium]|jgi:preprotein translocase subunit SecG
MSILIGIFTFVLILISVFLVLVILAQKSKSDGGIGGALGGGATEAAFGADTGNVLTKLTINAGILFFVLTFGLYLGHIYMSKHSKTSEGLLPTIAAPAVPSATAPAAAPATTETVAPAETTPAVSLPTTTTAPAAPVEAAKP